MSAPTQTTPNQYHLKAHGIHANGIHVDYFPFGDGDPGPNGPLRMKYQDHEHSLTDFYAKDVRVVSAPDDLGTIVSVTIDRSIDSGDTTFSLVVPDVVVPDSGEVEIETFAITTTHYAISPVAQPQRETYTVNSLKGAAANGTLPV